MILRDYYCMTDSLFYYIDLSIEKIYNYAFFFTRSVRKNAFCSGVIR